MEYNLDKIWELIIEGDTTERRLGIQMVRNLIEREKLKVDETLKLTLEILADEKSSISMKRHRVFEGLSATQVQAIRKAWLEAKEREGYRLDAQVEIALKMVLQWVLYN